METPFFYNIKNRTFSVRLSHPLSLHNTPNFESEWYMFSLWYPLLHAS